MAGLFGGNFDDPKTQGLLQLGLAMMQGSGPSPVRRPLASIIGEAGQSGIGAYKAAQDRKKAEALNAIKMQLMQAQMQDYLAKAKMNAARAESGIDPDLPGPVVIVNEIEKAEKLGDQKRADLLRWAVRNPYQSWGGVGWDTRSGEARQVTPTELIAGIRERIAAANERGTQSEKIFPATGPDNQPIFATGAQIRGNLPQGGMFSGARLPPQSGFPVVSEEEQIARDRMANRVLDQEGLPPQQLGFGRFAPGAAGSSQVAQTPQTIRPPAAGEAKIAADKERAVIKERQVGKLKESLPKARAALYSLDRSTDRMVNEIDDLLKSPGINLISGAVSNLPLKYVKGTPAYDAAVKLQYLLDNVVIETMKDLKKLSETGSTGFGQMSEKEGLRLENGVVPLREGTSTPEMIRALNNLKQWAIAQKYQSRALFDEEFGDIGGSLDFSSKRGAEQPSTSTSGGWSIKKVQ